jgi:hypothetical protein
MKSVSGVKALTVLGSVCVMLCFSAAASTEESGSEDTTLGIERVALFKNGLGFFTSSTRLPQGAETVRLGQLPVPSFGTFWVGYPKDVKVRRLVTVLEELEEKMLAQSIGELLEMNPGCKVRLHIGPDDSDVIEGIVVSGSLETAVSEATSPYFMNIRRRRELHGRRLSSFQPGRVLLVETDRGTVALNPGSIIRADFDRCELIDFTPIQQKRPSVRIELERPARGQTVTVSYLAKGATWSPAYLIDLSDPETARLSARALVINEVGDLKNVRLELVTGFPNIKFGELLSPVAMSQSLADFLKALARGRTEPRRDDWGLTAQAGVITTTLGAADFEAPLVPGYSTAAEGLISEDLFLYPVEDFTLMKDETAWIPLFTAEMPYKHIYTWKVGDYLDREDRYRDEPDRRVAEEVWHSCRLINSLEMPLTTAAAEFVTDGAFTGQDVCYYTAPGAETTIRINRAMNLLAEQAEVEIGRTRHAATFQSRSYDLVKVRGELRLESKMDKSADVEVTKDLSGEILETLPDAKDVKTAKGLRHVNPRHVLTWEIQLRPGEERTLSYVYQVYIRS